MTGSGTTTAKARAGLERARSDRIPDRWFDLGFALILVAAVPALVYFGRSMTFWQDEWTFVGYDLDSLSALLAPHNEHWYSVPRLLYSALLATVGLSSYLPYLALLATLHVLGVGGVYLLLVRRLARPVAFVLALPLVVLGAGYENLLWAFQIGFVGSVAAGVWAIVALESPRPRAGLAGALLLVVSLASSGMGLVLFAVAAVRLLVDPDLRRRTAWLAVPATIYAVWFVGFGRSSLSGGSGLAPPLDVVRFTFRGVLNAVSRFSGLDHAGAGAGPAFAAVLVVLAVVGLVWIVRVRRSIPALGLASLAGLAGMYVLIGLVRSDLDPNLAERSRYVYVAAFLIIMLTADLVAGLTPARARQGLVAIGLAGLLLLPIVVNAVDLRAGRATFAGRADLTRGYLTVLQESGGDAWVDPAGRLPGMSETPELLRQLSRLGWPTTDQFLPGVVRPPSAVSLDRGLVMLAGDGFSAEAGLTVSGTPISPVVLGAADARVAWRDGCIEIEPGGPAPAVTLEVPDGGAVTLTGVGKGASATLGHDAPPGPPSRIDLPSVAGTSTVIRVPDIGDGSDWRVGIDLGTSGQPTTACVAGR